MHGTVAEMATAVHRCYVTMNRYRRRPDSARPYDEHEFNVNDDDDISVLHFGPEAQTFLLSIPFSLVTFDLSTPCISRTLFDFFLVIHSYTYARTHAHKHA